jgi:hypothetical protein
MKMLKIMILTIAKNQATTVDFPNKKPGNQGMGGCFSPSPAQLPEHRYYCPVLRIQ